jgi:hypothetical protein
MWSYKLFKNGDLYIKPSNCTCGSNHTFRFVLWNDINVWLLPYVQLVGNEYKLTCMLHGIYVILRLQMPMANQHIAGRTQRKNYGSSSVEWYKCVVTI